eukprot:153997_1
MAPWWQYHKTICTLSLTAAFLVFNWTNYAKECLEVIFQGIREAVQYVATSCGNFAKDRPVRFLCQFVVVYLCIALFKGYRPFPYHTTFKERPVACKGVDSFLKDHQIHSRWVSKSLPVGSVLTLDCPFPVGKDAHIEVTCVEKVVDSEPLDTESLGGVTSQWTKHQSVTSQWTKHQWVTSQWTKHQSVTSQWTKHQWVISQWTKHQLVT